MEPSFATQSIAGCFGGLLSGLISQPFDTIKIHRQSGQQIPRSFVHLYKGLLPQLQVQIWCNSVLFGLYNYFKDSVFRSDKSVCFKSAAITGAIEACIYNPLELIKTRAQLGMPYPKVNEMFRGIEYCILRESIGNCIYFSSYFYSKKYLIEQDFTEKTAILTAGGLSGIFYWTIIYPFDTLKTRKQSVHIA